MPKDVHLPLTPRGRVDVPPRDDTETAPLAVAIETARNWGDTGVLIPLRLAERLRIRLLDAENIARAAIAAVGPLARCPDCDGKGGRFEPRPARKGGNRWKDCDRCGTSGLVPERDVAEAQGA